jgi:release factor glutamine methyltransferase
VTVLEAIQRGAEFLGEKGIESPRLQTELLLAHALRIPRLKLYLRFDQALEDSELNAARELFRRRAHREPLQHIVGSVSFCGLDLAVGPEVLIPRPETEVLAERCWEFLCQQTAKPTTVCDFGAGSGCLAIALTHRCSHVVCHALDISAEAINLARKNAARHGLTERIHFHVGDGFQALDSSDPFDLVVSNPPYIPSADILKLAPEVRDHDPRIALDGGPDGLDFYRRLAREGRPRLKASGRLFAEFGDGQADAVAELFRGHNWIVESLSRDYSGSLRVLEARPSET